MSTKVQEAQRDPGRINPRMKALRLTKIKLTKIKDRDKMLKATREKQQKLQGNSHHAIS